MKPPWTAKDVMPIDGDKPRFIHVVRHLYNAEECWVQVRTDLGEPRARAQQIGCARPCLSRKPDFDAASPSCRLHVLSDHNERYAPAYLAALKDAEATGRIVQLPRDGHGPEGNAFVDRYGVFVIARKARDQAPKVMTAYRVRPAQLERPRIEDFFAAAVQKLQDKSPKPRRIK